jgi:dCTP deaminase
MLSDDTISKLVANGEINLYLPGFAECQNRGLDDSQFQPASIDLRLGDTELYEFPGQSGVWQLEAGRHTLACTAEYIGITSSLAGRVDGKSSWARKGLLVHTAGFIDPGFRGQITLELKNLGHKPIMLRRLNPICQVSFDWLDAPARRPYGHPGLKSHYQGQTGITHYGGPQ